MREITEVTSKSPLLLSESQNLQLEEFYRSATSDNTRKSYRSAVRQYQKLGGNLPATNDDIVRYLVLASERYKVATIQVHLSALSAWHVFQGVSDPVSSAVVRRVLKGVKRTKGMPQNKAEPITLADLAKISNALKDAESRLNALALKRDRALILLGFFGAFRRSELVDIDVSDLKFDRQGVEVLLRKSKTDQFGEGIVKAIPFGAEGFCPVEALESWLDAASIGEGSAFRPVNQWRQVAEKRLSSAAVSQIIKRACRLAGMDRAAEFSGHSLRRGMATEAARAGASFESIRKQGGWKNDATVRGYIEEGNRFKDNAGTLLARQLAAIKTGNK